MSVVKFPYNACRSVHSRKPRRSKNGTPEERAAKAATAAALASANDGAVIKLSHRNETPSRSVRIMKGLQWDEFLSCLAPDQQQAFMAEVYKIMNRYLRRIE